MADAYPPYKIPLPSRDGDRSYDCGRGRGRDYDRGRGWDDERRDRSMDRAWNMRRDRDRSRSRERRGPRDCDLDWNRRPPAMPKRSPLLDAGSKFPGPSTSPTNVGPTPSSRATSISSPALNAPPSVNLKAQRYSSEQEKDLLEPLCDLIWLKGKKANLEQVLAGRRSDLARQQEKTPDFPASWQAIQRGVTSGERDLSKCTKEYQQHKEWLLSVLAQLSGPKGNFLSNVVSSVVPGHSADAPLPNTSRTGPNAMQKVDPLEARLAELEKQQQAATAKMANEMQALQVAVMAATMECEEIQKKEQAMLRREKAADDLTKDHQNLVFEYQRLDERCTALETENKKLSSDHAKLSSDYTRLSSDHKRVSSEYKKLSSEHCKFERLLESNRKTCEELDKKVDKPRLEHKKLWDDVEKARSELESIKNEQSQSEDRHQKASTALRGNLKNVTESYVKMVSRISNLEKRATTTEDSLIKITDDLNGPKVSAESGPRTTDLTPGMSAEIMEKLNQVTTHSQAIAGLTTSLQTMGDLVESHQSVLGDFDPTELDTVFWDNKSLKEQFSALEKLHDELRAEVQDAKQRATHDVSWAAPATAPPRTPTPSPGAGNSQHTNDAIRIAEDAHRAAERAAKYSQMLKKAQDSLIEAMGRMIEKARSDVKGVEKHIAAEFASIKERIDVLEKPKDEGKHSPINTGIPGAQPNRKAGITTTADEDLVHMKAGLQKLGRDITDTNDKAWKLEKSVMDSLSENSDRLEGLQQLFLDSQRQAANTGGPSLPALTLPPLQPPAGTGMVRPTSDSPDSRRPNGSVKRRRMDSPRHTHSRTPPAANGLVRH